MATTTFSIIFAGDAVTEIGAILVALLTKEVVANIPESSLMDALRGLPVESNSIIPSESYGKPPTLVIPIKSLPKGVIQSQVFSSLTHFVEPSPHRCCCC